MTSVALTTLDGPATRHAATRFADLYLDVFTAPPWNEQEAGVQQFQRRLIDDTHRPGFRALVAHLDDRWAGFATGWPTQQPFPTNRAYGAVLQQLGAQHVTDLLIDALEVDELAVSSAAQGHGIGAQLLNALLHTTPDGRAWLLTSTSAPQAIRFYQRQGWHPTHPTPAEDGQVVVFLSPQYAHGDRGITTPTTGEDLAP